MKTIVAGSRDGFGLADVYTAIARSGFERQITEVVSGGARGVDRFGEMWAQANATPIKQFIPDWNGPLGKAAGHARNRDMGDYADALVALWDGKSKGTKGMIDYAKKKGLKVYVYQLGEEV